MAIPITTSSGSYPGGGGRWWMELSRYHWFVLGVTMLGWLFDTMDQQLFNLARGPAISELRGPGDVKLYGGLATTIFMIGWATGGVIFGILGDRLGRAKTMVITILIYSLFTGLSSLSVSFWDFAFYRFLTGLGVGGEIAVGVALVAEVMPDRARSPALGWLMASSAVGNITAALVGLALAPLEAAGLLGEWKPWRWMFVVGALPALLVIVIRRRLKEPEKWVALQAGSREKLGSVSELFGHPTWRRNAFIGLAMGTAGVVGLWGIGFFSFDLTRSVFRQTFDRDAEAKGERERDQQFVCLVIRKSDQIPDIKKKIQPNNLVDTDARKLLEAMFTLSGAGQSITTDSVLAFLDERGQTDAERGSRKEILNRIPPANEELSEHLERLGHRTLQMEGYLTWWASINGILLNSGAFFGMHAFSWLSQYFGRKPAFTITFIAAPLVTAFTFWNLKTMTDVYWMVPIMGFWLIAPFAGYAIYFPELFPTRLRATGTSFCYNVGRYLASPGPLLLGFLAKTAFGHLGDVTSWRWAGVTMCSFYLVGLVALVFAPETKGKPLPE